MNVCFFLSPLPPAHFVFSIMSQACVLSLAPSAALLHVAFVRYNNMLHLNLPAIQFVGDHSMPRLLFTIYFPLLSVCHYLLLFTLIHS